MLPVQARYACCVGVPRCTVIRPCVPVVWESHNFSCFLVWPCVPDYVGVLALIADSQAHMSH